MTDYYSVVEEGLVQLLKTELLNYFPNGDDQVTKSDDTVLDNGNDYYAITYPGAFPITEETSSFLEYSWSISLDILIRWTKTAPDAWAKFKVFRSDIIYLINHRLKGRDLGKTSYVREAVISSEDPPNYIPQRGSSPDNPIFTHIRQVCNVTVKQIVPRE